MPPARNEALEFARSHREELLHWLSDFIAIPSVSTDPDHRDDVLRAADWLATELKDLSMDHVELFPTPPSHPIVYGEWTGAGPDAPTVLIYGHYDVQPADPIEPWESDPFEATRRGDDLYGRGATDMKGQVAAALQAIRATGSNGDYPLNFKILLEGEEETGSAHLGEFIAQNRDLLRSTLALNPDTGMLAPDLPTITYALRGLAYFELRLYGPRQDLHSGVFGGVVHNPAQVLCELVAGMHDEDAKVTLPGFYEPVRELDPDERQALSRLPMDEQFYREQAGVTALWGEEGYTPVERASARPTLEVNGIYSGFIGEGSKTVLPSYAMAKISTRLVPDQKAKEVKGQLEAYLQARTPETVRWELEEIAGGPASITERDSEGIQAMYEALKTVWGVDPVYKREGGSVPVVAYLQEHLHIDTVNTGFALPSDNMHGPNEKVHVPGLYRGVEAIIHFFYNLLGE